MKLCFQYFYAIWLHFHFIDPCQSFTGTLNTAENVSLTQLSSNVLDDLLEPTGIQKRDIKDQNKPIAVIQRLPPSTVKPKPKVKRKIIIRKIIKKVVAGKAKRTSILTQSKTLNTTQASEASTAVHSSNSSNSNTSLSSNLTTSTSLKGSDLKKPPVKFKSSKRVKVIKTVKKVYVKARRKPKVTKPKGTRKIVKKVYVKRKQKQKQGVLQTNSTLTNSSSNVQLQTTTNSSTPLVKAINAGKSMPRRIKRQVTMPRFRHARQPQQPFYAYAPPSAPPRDEFGAYLALPQLPPQRFQPLVANRNDLIDTILNPWHFHIAIISTDPQPVPPYQELLSVASQYAPVFNMDQPPNPYFPSPHL